MSTILLVEDDPGDVLMTGTPEGVGPVLPGDIIKASVAGIGSVEVKVIAA